MKRLFIISCLSLSIAAFCTNATAAAKRIVSLKPNITKILIDIGAKDQIVGITRYCEWPSGKTPLRIADYLGPRPEAVVALKPDLIITSEENSVRAPIEALKELDLNIVMLKFGTLNEIKNSIIKMGELTGHEGSAGKFASGIKRILDHDEPAGKTVLMFVGTRPLVAVGKGTYLNEIIEHAGGKNIAPSRKKYPRISVEVLPGLNPDIIVDITPSGIPDVFKKDRCVVKLDGNSFQQPGTYTISAFDEMRSAIKEGCREK